MSKESKFHSSSRRREDIQVSDLRELLSRKEEDLNKTRATLDGIREERDQLRRKIHNLLSELNHVKETRSSSSGRLTPQDHSPNPGTLAISRKAGRIKLRKTSEIKKAATDDEQSKKKIHGTDLDPQKLSSATTEHVVQNVTAASGIQEIFCGLDMNAKHRDSFEMKLRHNFELELERMNCRFERLRSENSLLRLTLQESKSKTEQLQMLLSKFESNNAAHVMTLFYSEMVIEGLQAILNIFEKEILRNPHLEGILSHAKESHIRHLQKVDCGLEMVMLDDLVLSGALYNVDNFLEQWQDRDEPCKSLGPSDITSALDLCRKAEEKKKAVKRSIINLESFSVEALQNPSKSEKNVSDFDLENAVLLHELATVKEELINLKCESRKLNNDGNAESTNFVIQGDLGRMKASESSSTTSFDFAFNGSIQSLNGNDTESELDRKPAFLSLADLRIGTMTESELGTELSEALKREERLKKDNDRLAFSLQQVQQNSERRHQKSLEVMSSLKKSYSTLLENSKKDKLKHISRVQELDRLLFFSEEQHLKQIHELKQQILVYERERENWVLPDNETAL